jgi:hypothetical protein
VCYRETAFLYVDSCLFLSVGQELTYTKETIYPSYVNTKRFGICIYYQFGLRPKFWRSDQKEINSFHPPCTTQSDCCNNTHIEATPLSATSAELGLGLGLGLGLDSLSHSSSHALPFFSPPSFHTLSLSPAFTSVWWSG